MIRERNILSDLFNKESEEFRTETLLKILKERDPLTHEHSVEVATFSAKLAEYAGYSEQEVKEIEKGAMLHDIGKLIEIYTFVHESRKPTDEEWRRIKKHPRFGADILKFQRLPERYIRIALLHHRKFNGEGYPDVTNDEMPEGRIPHDVGIVTVGDNLSAMFRGDRGELRSPVRIDKEIKEEFEAGKFDPNLEKPYIEFSKDPFIQSFMQKKYEANLKRKREVDNVSRRSL